MSLVMFVEHPDAHKIETQVLQWDLTLVTSRQSKDGDQLVEQPKKENVVIRILIIRVAKDCSSVQFWI